MPEQRVIPGSTVRNIRDAGETLRQLAGAVDEHRALARITAAAESGNARLVTVQVMDRNKAAWAGRWRVRVWIAATENGDPASGYTVTFGSGAVIQTVIIGGMWEVLTTAAGLLTLTLTVAGVATPWVYAEVVGQARGKEVAFA